MNHAFSVVPVVVLKGRHADLTHAAQFSAKNSSDIDGTSTDREQKQIIFLHSSHKAITAVNFHRV